MNVKPVYRFIFVCLMIISLPPLIVLSQKDQGILFNPSSTNDDFIIFVPFLNSGDNSPAPEPTSTPGPLPTPISGDVIIADHTKVDEFEQIPDDVLPDTIAKRVLFKHASVGGYIDAKGLNCIQGTAVAPQCDVFEDYKYDRRNWIWPLWDNLYGGAEGKIEEFVAAVEAQHDYYDVLGMKFCYVDTWNLDWNRYRDNMLYLESNYPEKTFIWSTVPVISDCTSPDLENTCQIISNFNSNLRTFSLANDKPLFDIAAIESHDSKGSICISNGYEKICDENVKVDGLGHPSDLGSLRLAKGFWWLMARIAGWSG